MSSPNLIVRTLLLMFAFASIAIAQPAQSALNQLALEIHFYPGEPAAYQRITQSGAAGSWYSRFRRIKATGVNDLPVNAIDIKPQLTESGVRVYVSVLFGELHEKQKAVGTYTIHEGEKVKIQELAQFGVDPFVISVVNFAAAAFDLPEFFSKAKSIDYVGIQPTTSLMPTFRIAVRNLSSKNMRALMVNVMKGGESHLSLLPQGKEGAPLIVPGHAFEFDARVTTQSVPSGSGYTQVTVPGQVVEISTAIFDDGSFEGDPEPALAYAATLRGEKMQLPRVIDLVQRTIDDNQTDPATRIESLKTSIAMLSLESDPAIAQEVMAEFGQPTKRTPQEIKGVVETGMRLILQHALNMTQQFQLRNPKPNPQDVNRWLPTVKQRYADWLQRLGN